MMDVAIAIALIAPALLPAAVTAAVPLLLAGLGELLAERSGVINIGIEGLLLAGCIAGFAAAASTGSPWAGLAASVLAGAALAAVFAIATVWWRADQIVVGMAINLLAAGAAGAAWAALQSAGHGYLPAGAGFARSGPAGIGSLPGGEPLLRRLADLPLVGPVLIDQYGILHVAIVLAIALRWWLRRTRGGLIVRALGDDPDACAAAGIAVRRWRTLCVIAAGACAGGAGAYLSIMRTHAFVPDMTGGKGFLVLALVIFGRWSVGGLVAGCLLFGVLESLQQALQSAGYTASAPTQAFKLLPYAGALAVLAALRGGGAGPRHLGRPWPAER